METEIFKFDVRNKGGLKGGQPIEGRIETFDWGRFRNLPGAEAFVRKAYIAQCRNSLRAAAIEKDRYPRSSTESIVPGMEQAILDALKQRKKQIDSWFASRKWAAAGVGEDMQRTIRHVVDHPGDQTLVDKARVWIAEVADKPTDLIADYLFLKLDPAHRHPQIKAEDL